MYFSASISEAAVVSEMSVRPEYILSYQRRHILCQNYWIWNTKTCVMFWLSWFVTEGANRCIFGKKSVNIYLLVLCSQKFCFSYRRFVNIVLKLHLCNKTNQIRMELLFHPDPARKLSAKRYDIYHCCVYSEKLLVMDRGTVWNM
jgi:hypothetical protein